MQPVPPADTPPSSATSSFDAARLMARQAQAQTGANQLLHPAASSFAASAANTATAMGGTLSKAQDVLRKSDSQVKLYDLTAD